MIDYTTTYVFPWHTQWCARVETFDVRQGRAAALAQLVRSGRPAILHGASGLQRGYVDLLAAAALARRRRPVLLAEATWQRGSRALDRLLKASPPIGADEAPRHGRRLGLGAIRLIDGPSVHYAVLSRSRARHVPTRLGRRSTACPLHSLLRHRPGAAGPADW